MPVQFGAFVITVRRNCSGSADDEMIIGIIVKFDFRHLLISINHPTLKHFLQCTVFTEFGKKFIGFFF